MLIERDLSGKAGRLHVSRSEIHPSSEPDSGSSGATKELSPGGDATSSKKGRDLTTDARYLPRTSRQSY